MNVELHTPAKAESFAGLFQHIKLFTGHINILFQTDKMFVQGMDSSRVSIFEIYLPAAWFDKYELTDDVDVTLGINVNIFSKVLATRDKAQMMRLTFSGNEDDKLFVDFVSTQSGVYDKSFEVPLMEIESEMMMIPPSESQAEFSVPAVKFAVLMDQLKVFGETIQFECSETAIQLTSHSQDCGKMKVDIPIDDLTSFAINEGQNLSLSYSLTHLHNICLYSKIAPEITIHMSTNFPIKMVFSVDNNSGAQIVFYLAPKLTDDDL
jgi:proliferating cell nuclear antigen PCNA